MSASAGVDVAIIGAGVVGLAIGGDSDEYCSESEMKWFRLDPRSFSEILHP